MSTSQSTVEYILDQTVYAGKMTSRKMFGEYALYCDGKVVGLVCDDTLFIKITEKGKLFVGEYYQEGHAYPGAKASMVIDDGRIEDHEWLSKLIRITTDCLPIPKQKKIKKLQS
jgi:TfoX/Sxy family transcriptional regulator of competence genes